VDLSNGSAPRQKNCRPIEMERRPPSSPKLQAQSFPHSSEDKVEGSVKLVHAVGMHARPAVKLSKLAKRFRSRIAVRVEPHRHFIYASHYEFPAGGIVNKTAFHLKSTVSPGCSNRRLFLCFFFHVILRKIHMYYISINPLIQMPYIFQIKNL